MQSKFDIARQKAEEAAKIDPIAAAIFFLAPVIQAGQK